MGRPPIARAVRELPGYPLAGIARRKKELVEAGEDVIDLGAGDADLPPPPAAVEALQKAAADPSLTRYPFQLGLPAFREEVARWMERRFGVGVDPYAEVLPLIGSKEGLAHLALTVVEDGTAGIVPDPGYQPYTGGTILAGGHVERVPLREENGFRVPLEELSKELLERARILFLNYPNNPTAGTADLDYFRQAVDLCRRHDVVLVHDHAYSEIAFDGYRPPSLLEAEGARDVGVEFHSLSKTYNLTGWRLGWAVGNRDLVEALAKVKSYVDTGAYLGIQAGGVAALRSWDTWVPENVARFQARRDVLVGALRAQGFRAPSPRATMYCWAPVPGGEPSEAFAERALEDQGVVVLPGGGLGRGGEGFFRMALTVEEERLEEAARRLGRVRVTDG